MVTAALAALKDALANKRHAQLFVKFAVKTQGRSTLARCTACADKQFDLSSTMMFLLNLVRRSRCLLALSVLLSAPYLHAQITFGPIQEEESGVSEIRELNWMNHNYLDKQRQLADTTMRQATGRQLHQNRGDLRRIQRAIDSGALDNANKQTLQALGAALGDIFANEHKKFDWRVYEDDAAASHAVCLIGTEHCLFPMTMISRRMEAGLKPDVTKIFNTNLDSLKKQLPYLPYSRDYSKETAD